MAKVASAREIVTAVRAALSGTPTFAMASPLPRPEPIRVPRGGAFADESLDALSGEGSANEPTPRQRAILSYLGRGTPNKAIARQMGLSENEVRAEVSFLTERLNATSRQQAYAEAVARGWVAP
jgi:DNA-binding NarL/FixJ family response regulator